MSVTEHTPISPFTGDGSTTTVAFAWPILAAADMKVKVDGVELALDVDFTVDIVARTVTFATAPASGAAGVLYRVSVLSRATDYQTAGDFRAAVVNPDFDRLWLVFNEILNGSRGSPSVVRAPAGETLDELPAAADRLGKVLSFHPTTGEPMVSTPTAGDATSVLNTLAAEDGSGLVGFIRSATGAVGRTVSDKLLERVSLDDFGVLYDGSDESSKVQAAVNHCLSSARPKALIVNGRVRLGSSVNIDRTVDTNSNEFRIIGEGAGGGFYTTGNVTMFDSTLTVTTDPRSELVSFENIRFESSSFFNTSYVMSQKFLRIKFQNCFFYLVRCMTGSIYAQTWHFISCNIRNSPSGFLNCAGSFDISFLHCIIENNFRIFRSVDSVRGAAGIRFVDNVIEGQQESTASVTGASGFVVSGNHIESNPVNDWNFFAGSVVNGAILIEGNYIYNPNGVVFYYGPTTAVVSSGNFCSPGVMHGNVTQVTNFISAGDSSSGGVSDATVKRTINGITRAGGAQDAWTDSASHITKSASGEFSFGYTPVTGVRHYVRGAGTTSSTYGLVVTDSAGADILQVRDDKNVRLPSVNNYANDSTAAAGGVPVGGLYRNGSVLQIRIT